MAEGSSTQELISPPVAIKFPKKRNPQSEHVLSKPPITSFLEAQTGQPFSAIVWRGVGRENKTEIYDPNTAQEGVFGNAIYSTPNPLFAMKFGHRIEKFTVTLKNPLVISNDEEWNAITTKAGLLTNAPRTHKEVQQLRRLVLAKGHDGVIIKVPLSVYGSSAIIATFMDKTVVDFGGVFLRPPVPASPRSHSEKTDK